MRTFGLLAWLMVPVLVGAYHYGPGPGKAPARRRLAAAGRGRPRWPRRSNGRKPRREYEKALALLPRRTG